MSIILYPRFCLRLASQQMLGGRLLCLHALNLPNGQPYTGTAPNSRTVVFRTFGFTSIRSMEKAHLL